MEKPNAKELSPQQKEFARRQLFGFTKEITLEDGTVEKKAIRMNNTTQSYLSVYKCKNENVASGEGSKLLRKPTIQAYQKQLLEDAGWNDRAIDNRTMEIAMDGEGTESMAAIREYNKIRSRITEKKEVAVTGIDIVRYGKD